ncbi:DUF6175 family protein [Prevotella sp. MA2016]|jgi:hypothetical protein|uniref:DUF6175 family protein n=1 Tax=Prevotella sp. MA2016 TaxID=1408310 RepID=UPI00068791CD|nr:DUF6175 family protein [Prevotella sp. MA2016]
MKIKTLLSIMMLTAFSLSAMAQAKKPTLMVVPSEAWCKAHGYEQTFDNQGMIEEIPDYKAAVSSDQQLNAIISKINTLMADRGFPLKDLQQNLRSISNLSAEDRLITSKTSGSNIQESPLDRLRRTAKADILLEIDWMVNTVGPKSSITYNLRAIDAYSNKQVAGAQGTGKGSFSAEIPVLLEEAVQDHMDSFVERLQSHFDDLLTNGREVVLDMRVFDIGTIDFEKMYGDLELSEVIDNWLSDNCVNHRFSKSDATESMILYEQVRIPLYKANGSAQDTYGFARELARFLGASPYNITVKTVNRGLGRCLLILGEK